MQNFGKIYPDRLAVPAVGAGLFPKFKEILRGGFPFFLKTAGVGFVLLVFQAFVVGLLDRFGVSPKTAFLFSSLFYAAVFVLLAVWGGVGFSEKVRLTEESLLPQTASQPICKILIIRQTGEQK